MDDFKYRLTDKNAKDPFKSRQSDSGFDLTLIKKVKENGEIIMYDTCVQVQPPKGYYFDVIPRSSIIKSGYILANSVGIIDSEYTGNIYVPLIKVDKSKPDIELPIRLVQLIPRKYYNFNPIKVEHWDDEIMKNNTRKEKGFGSSGK